MTMYWVSIPNRNTVEMPIDDDRVAQYTDPKNANLYCHMHSQMPHAKNFSMPIQSDLYLMRRMSDELHHHYLNIISKY